MTHCTLDNNAPPIEEHNETDNVTSIELHRNRRVLYFSDGTMEETSDTDNEYDADVPDKSLAVNINEADLALGPLLKYKAYKVGSNILAGIDYIGGGLASLLGISTPKYASELEYYKRSMVDAEGSLEENLSNTWLESNNNNHSNAIVTEAPKFNS